jgi:flagellar motor switch protein FliM
MAYDKFLSQDEVDELLKGVSGESDTPAVSAPVTEDGVRPYNLATQERIVRGRLHTLEIINERFARQMRTALFNFIRRGADISVGTIMKPLRGTALFVFDPNLVFLVVDNLFGGDGRFHTRVEGRDFTQTEQRIIKRMLDLTLTSYGHAWGGVHPIEFEYVRSEMHTKFANIAMLTEVVVSTAFHIEFGAVGGQLHVCFPYSMIEPVRDLLMNPLQDEVEVDKRWIHQLSEQLHAAEVQLVAEFAHVQSTVAEVLALRAGDVLPLDMPEHIFGKVDGVPVMQAGFGTMNGQYALRIEHMINHQESDSNKENDND